MAQREDLSAVSCNYVLVLRAQKIYVRLCATMFITSIFFSNSCHRADLCGSPKSKRGSALCQQWHRNFCQYCYNESTFRLHKQALKQLSIRSRTRVINGSMPTTPRGYDKLVHTFMAPPLPTHHVRSSPQREEALLAYTFPE